ncbi:MAG: DUF2333 family protein [Pseudomonadota bacterium]
MPDDTDLAPSRWARFRYFNPLATGLGPAGRLLRGLALCVLIYALCAPAVMWYEYDRAFPAYFNPAPPAAPAGETAPTGESGAAPAPAAVAPVPAAQPARGVVYADTLIRMGEQMLRAWLPNDVIWPSVLLDNPQNFQLGQLEVMRYTTRVLRDKLSRQRTTDKIDADADLAFTAFSNNPRAWMLPSAESKYNEGLRALKRYREGLARGSSHFYSRSDNLVELLEQLTSLLGGVDTRLANAPRDWPVRLSEETAGDRYSQGESSERVKVPWTQIDDNFYFARGVAYGIREVLAALRWEFKEIISIKRSGELLDNVIDELGLADFEPLWVLNGSRDSIFANHSLSMMATLEDARQKLINLQHVLER